MMRMVDLIQKKKEGKELTSSEFHFIIDGYVHDKIPDYQMSAWMMAICFQGMNARETSDLTKEMVNSGQVFSLEKIHGIKVDKHSTGGIGDKTSLVVGPMVGACGVPVAKMSGRGLGYTGGTLDKLESIPGMKIHLSQEQFIHQVNDCHFSIIGQSEDLDPADKKMYALRDVTATVDSKPLIASSIMSKKIAAGADAILLDVKYGNGAFMKNKEDAIELAQLMVDIGHACGKDTRATISNMNQPLGKAIGNNLEVIEAIHTLNGEGPDDLLELCLEAGSQMLLQAKKAQTLLHARSMLEKVIVSKEALHVLSKMVKSQGGNEEYILHPELFPQAKYIFEIKSSKEGYVETLNAQVLGLVSMKLGGGREKQEDLIDFEVGIVLNKKIGDCVEKGDVLVYVHANKKLSKELENEILGAYKFSQKFVEKPILIEKIL